MGGLRPGSGVRSGIRGRTSRDLSRKPRIKSVVWRSGGPDRIYGRKHDLLGSTVRYLVDRRTDKGDDQRSGFPSPPGTEGHPWRFDHVSSLRLRCLTFRHSPVQLHSGSVTPSPLNQESLRETRVRSSRSKERRVSLGEVTSLRRKM